jgi:hypothetical protein
MKKQCDLMKKWEADNELYQRMNKKQRAENLRSILPTYSEGLQKEALKLQIKKLETIDK